MYSRTTAGYLNDLQKRFAEINFVEASILAEKLHSGMFCWKLSRQLRLGPELPGHDKVDARLPLPLIALTAKVQD
jgi:hypothetical protein